ncbi:MAG: FtsW/RodA/SpoVE family cell cycle protein [Bacteroidales bacterium]|nr:FtsW/RodA/SpoVE family cell cycle protein [Bacteroidales bacterium]
MDWKKVEEKLNFMDRLAGDKVVWIIVLFLCLISLVAIFSSTSQLATEATTRIDIIRTHFLTVLGGLVLILLLYKIDNIKVFKWFSRWGFLLSAVMLLFLDLHLKIGPVRASSINGAWRILKLGGFQIHVFEIVKVAMVMYLAWAVDTYRNGGFKLLDKLSEIDRLQFLGRDIWKRILYIYLPILIICVASLPGGNSNAMFIAALMFLTILLAGLPFRDILVMGAVAVLLLLGCVGIWKVSGGKYFDRIGTAVSRLSHHSADNETLFVASQAGSDDYQKTLDKIRQPIGAKLAVKSGGIIGKGPGNSAQKYVVPVIYEDYIFSFFIEEYGILGGILVIILYISLLARASIIVRNCDDKFAKYAIAGLSVMITAQAMMHILVNCDVGLLTGQTLPLISYGTSAFLCISIAFGIILSISRMASKKVEREAAKADPIVSFKEDDVRDRLDLLNDYESADRLTDLETLEDI